jgi:hypothetical protein
MRLGHASSRPSSAMLRWLAATASSARAGARRSCRSRPAPRSGSSAGPTQRARPAGLGLQAHQRGLQRQAARLALGLLGLDSAWGPAAPAAGPATTCSPSRTSSSRRMPPSRLAMTCSRPSGTTRAVALATMSTCASAAQATRHHHHGQHQVHGPGGGRRRLDHLRRRHRAHEGHVAARSWALAAQALSPRSWRAAHARLRARVVVHVGGAVHVGAGARPARRRGPGGLAPDSAASTWSFGPSITTGRCRPRRCGAPAPAPPGGASP